MAIDTENRDIIRELRKFLTETSNYSNKIYQRTKEEDEFACGNQFTTNDDRVLGKDGARLTFNLIGKYENAIVNPFLTHPYGISVSSKTQDSQQKALKLTSILRGIEYKNNAVDEYGSALRSAVRTGYGFVYISTEYTNTKSFDQDIIIGSVLNSRCVAFDINSKKLDGSDANCAAFVDFMDEDEAESKYGKDITKESKFSLNGLSTNYDIPADSIPVVTYFKKEITQSKYYKTVDGRVGTDLDFTKPEISKATSRMIDNVKIMVYKVIGNKVIEETTLPISYIPIVPFYGKKVVIDGKNQYVGIVYDAKSAQKLVNYNASKMAERIARTPKNQWVSPEESIVGDPHWSNADTGLYSVLTYKEKDADGNPIAGRPTLQQSNVDISDVLQAKLNFEKTLADIIGMPEGGNLGGINETAESVLLRKNTIDNNNSHFYYNAKSSIKHIGRICTELVTKYFDTAREQIIINAEGKPIKMIIDVSEMAIKPEDFDIEISAGPSEASSKNDNIKMLVAFGSMLPETQKIFIGPLIAKNLDIEGSERLVKQLEMSIPPEFRDNGVAGGDPKAIEQLNMADQAIAKQMEVQAAMQVKIDSKEMQLQESYQYVRDLQSYIAGQEKKIQADILMNVQDNTNDIEIEQMKIQNSNAQLQAKISADAEKERIKQQGKLDELMAKTPPKSIIVDTSKPSFQRYI